MFGRKRHEVGGESAPDSSHGDTKWKEMAREVGPMSEQSVDRAEEERRLEEMRDKMIGRVIIDAIGGADRVRSEINKSGEFFNADLIVEALKGDFDNYTGHVVHGMDKPTDFRYAQAMYKAGVCAVAGSEDGLKKAFTADGHQFFGNARITDDNGVVGVNNGRLDPRELRMMQIGAHAMDERFDSAVRAEISRLAPDKSAE